MIHVIAAIEVKPGRLGDFLKIFKANVPNVLAESGCVHYEPTLDFDSKLPPQIPLRPNVMTVVEGWESLDHLNAHLRSPHMLAYKEAVKDMVVGVKLQVLRPA